VDVARFIREVTQSKTAIDEKTGRYGRAIVKGGAGTAARTAGLLSGIMTFAVQNGLRPDNPCHGVRKPAAGQRERRLDPADYRALGEALDESVASGGNPLAAAMVRVLALTGMRLGEVLTCDAPKLIDVGKPSASVTPRPGRAFVLYPLPPSRFSTACRPELIAPSCSRPRERMAPI
jgi:hypothetical protein